MKFIKKFNSIKFEKETMKRINENKSSLKGQKYTFVERSIIDRIDRACGVRNSDGTVGIVDKEAKNIQLELDRLNARLFGLYCQGKNDAEVRKIENSIKELTELLGACEEVSRMRKK